MMPMNNPVMQLVNAMKYGGNPGAILQQMMQQNPQVGQAMKIMNGKTPQQMREIVTNMCRERGTTPEEVARSLGLQISSNR